MMMFMVVDIQQVGRIVCCLEGQLRIAILGMQPIARSGVLLYSHRENQMACIESPVTHILGNEN